MKDDFEIIDLDETANIDKLALAEELARVESEQYEKGEYYEDENYEDYDESVVSDENVDDSLEESDSSMAEYSEPESVENEEIDEAPLADNADDALEYYEDEQYAEDQEDYVEEGYVEDYIEDGEVVYSQEEEFFDDGETAEYDDDLEYMDEESDYDPDLDYMDDESEYDSEEYDDAMYADEQDEDEDDDEYEEIGFFDKLKDKLSRINKTDWMVIGAGIAVFVVLIIALSIFAGGKNKKETASLYNVGYDLASLGVAGGDGLRGMAQYAMNYLNAPEEEEVEIDTSIIRVTFISMSEDIKIKFLTEDDRLITGIPFEVTLTYLEKDSKNLDEGEKVCLTDDNMDGIIQESDMEPGEYAVEITPVEGSTFVDVDETIKVKGEIEYQVIDVSSEVKKESEINAAVEDTAINAVVQETPTTTDTVEWVESTRTASDGGDGYNQIDKSEIKAPGSAKLDNAIEVASNILATAYSRVVNFYTLVREPSITITGGTSVEVGATITLTATANEVEGSIEWSSSDSSIATVQGGTVTGVAAGTVTITATCNGVSKDYSITVTEAGGGGQGAQEVTCTGVTISAGTSSLAVGGTTTVSVSATMSDGSTVTDISRFTLSSDNSGVASVNSTGTVTAGSAGEANIRAEFGGKSASCKITVANPNVEVTCTGVSLSSSSLTLAISGTSTIAATANMSDGSSVTEASKFTWKSSNESVVKVDSSGKLTAVAAGSATITVSYGEKSATCSVTVSADAESNYRNDTSTPLTTNSGLKVYVKNSDGTYRAATYADYYTATEFYVESTSYRYTGWQTIDGNTYYYDKNGNKVTGDQIIQGVSYSFTSDGILATNTSGSKGIDVSKWNGSINWTAVKNSGVSFVIIRCGYRGSTSGALIEDPTFRTNIQGARAAGLKVGIYFFTQAVTEAEAVEEASMAVGLARSYGVNYPIFIDTEGSGGRADGISRATRTAVCRAFCQTVQNSGFTAGVYASKAWFNSNVDYGQLSGYKIWLAQYASAPTFNNRYDLWQYTSKGSVAGISGNVDMNISYLGY